jgi:acetyltransferase-like isoleucine patch superfamily enzyme
MPIQLTQQLIEQLQSLGVSTLLRPGAMLPDDVIFEPPCSLKWMGVNHSLHLGAFSYAVSGFYFGCRIGRYCSFGEQIQIGRHPHPMHWVSTSPFFYWQYKDVLDQQLPDGIELNVHKDFKRSGPPVTAKLTVIGNDVWIGHGAFILPGVHIGDGAVIAAMSVATKNIPPYAVVAGSPAKVVRYRFPEEQIEALQASKWWEFAPWQMKGAQVDDIPAFLEFIAKLRSTGESVYAPEKIKLYGLIDGKANK